MRNFCLFTYIFLLTQSIYATQNISIESYIKKYSFTAQLESFRSGMPTSIILAQAILESEFGNSDLCSRSNNHFGIKWKSKNDGDFVYSLDDDYDTSGNLVPSKFVKYATASESFRHHTDFIMGRKHYKPLFKFSQADYERWAYGLRTCGYSTDSDYGPKLVKLIHRYKLNQYDLPKILSQTKPSKEKIKKLKPITNSPFGPFMFLQKIEDGKWASVSNRTYFAKADNKYPKKSNLPQVPKKDSKCEFISYINSNRFSINTEG